MCTQAASSNAGNSATSLRPIDMAPDQTLVDGQLLNVKNATFCINMGLRQLHSTAQQDTIAPPVYSVRYAHLGDLVYDQTSLDECWAYAQHYLKTQRLSESEMFAILSSGILYTPTGSKLAKLFVDAAIRSICPVGELATEKLRLLLEVICCFPPEPMGH
ncbi:hypothetical protein DKY63_05220 [Pseudomonas putida]|uniref:Uncharacterized protein n=1 Tax=Pseudomonas putida TaxID=303 RepID=A0A2Z4REG3_PSEPU|nr:hypothetical protein [Pseudomonas putida]AWY39336.1 hypothetical protein DKY63_05220 [Pseudomonas putida]